MEGVEPVFVFILLGFPVVFVLIWTLVLGLISYLSGWSRLAATYRAEDSDRLKWTGWKSGRIGFFDMRSTLWVAMTDKGLYLKLGPSFLFKFAHPPLLIPWSKMEDVDLKHLFFRAYTGFKVDGVNIWLRGDAIDGAEEYSESFARLLDRA